MIFNPSDVLTFNYEKNAHLTTYLLVKNTTNSPVGFKFKVSTPQKFYVTPSTGMIKPHGQVKAKIVLHRDIVDNAFIQRLHFTYGQQYKQIQQFKLSVQGNNQNQELNLTVIVQRKEQQVIILKKQLQKYKKTSYSPQSSSKTSKKGNNTIIMMAVGIMALFVGYLLPFRLIK